LDYVQVKQEGNKISTSKKTSRPSSGEELPVVLFAAGGTGGHLFPAIAVADYMRDKQLARPVFIGTSRMESELIPKLGYPFTLMPLTPPPRSVPKIFNWFFRFIRSYTKSRRLIKDESAIAVVCVGAYIGLPPGFAAAFSGTPLYLMESNVNLGKANLKLSSYAEKIITTYSETQDYVPKALRNKIEMLGNPLRSNLDPQIPMSRARSTFNLDPEKPTILIMGGSLGALSINNAISKLLDSITDKGWQVIWQTGKNYQPTRSLPPGVISSEFLDDMPSAYAASDLAICRSGATTCSELKLMGIPSILIPLPTAGSGEQKLNAKSMEKQGLAVMIEEVDIDTRLAEVITELMNNKAKRIAMKAEAVTDKKNIAKAISELILN